MTKGRPTEYKEEYIDKVDEYLKACKDEEKEFWKVRGFKSNSYEQDLRVRLPTIEDFAIYIGVSRKTIYNWRDTYDDFAEALEKIDSEQKIRLINNGLAGRYNPIISKLILSSNHGMKERLDKTSDDKPINTFSDEQVKRIAERISRGGSGDDSTSS